MGYYFFLSRIRQVCANTVKKGLNASVFDRTTHKHRTEPEIDRSTTNSFRELDVCWFFVEKEKFSDFIVNFSELANELVSLFLDNRNKIGRNFVALNNFSPKDMT